MTAADQDAKGGDSGPSIGWIRGSAAGVVFAAVLVLGTVPLFTDIFAICETVSEPARPVRETCKAPGIAETVPLIIVGLVLVWPVLESIELFGVGKISRRLDDHEDRQNEMKRTQDEILTSVRSTATSTASQTTNFFAAPEFASMVGDIAALKVQGRSESTSREADGGDGSNLESVLERLKPYLQLSRRLNDPSFRESVLDRDEISPALVAGDVELMSEVGAESVQSVETLDHWREANLAELRLLREAARGLENMQREALPGVESAAAQALASLRLAGFQP